MVLPTKFIDYDEYVKLLDLEENDIIMIHALDSVAFKPPTVDKIETSSVTMEHVHVQFLYAREACIYRDKESNMVIIIIPNFTDLSYEYLQDIHPDKGAWGYRLSPHGWDVSDPNYHDLEWSRWFFKDDTGKFDGEDVSTH